MAGRLTDRTAVVTGGGSGLGAAACLRFAREGARVVIADLDLAAARRVEDRIRAGDGQATAVRADVSVDADNEAMVHTALTAFGGVDVLLCNAGVPAVGTALKTDRDAWDGALAVMLTGTWLGMRAVLPHMVSRGSGSIIVQSSVAGLVGVKALAPYAAAKAGVIGLARQAAADFAAHRVRVNVICPGDVPTPLAEATRAAQVAQGFKTAREPAQAAERTRAHYPLGRLGTPDDIAAMAAFLASDDASWITGQTFVVDGGLTAV